MIKQYQYLVKLRRNLGLKIRPEAEQLDGNVYSFQRGWLIDEGHGKYEGETAMIPIRIHDSYPDDAPTWIASGDLILVEEKNE